MKIKPVIDAPEARGLDTSLVHTGQHYDEAMSDVFFADLGLRAPDFHLEVGSGAHGGANGLAGCCAGTVGRERPDIVVVVGDVNSTVACVGGLEVGYRARSRRIGTARGDWEMPEETNRVVTDRISDFLFACQRTPSPTSSC
jgi:UDP-N-acetylglucosamine 2-epimerase (non-hydrolysing)